MTGESPIILRTAKCWQTKDNILVWQVSSTSSTRDLVPLKKYFLVCDANQKTRGIRLSQKKPDGLFGQGSFINLIRKYAKTGVIGKPLADSNDNSIWLPLYTTKNEIPDYYVLLTKDQPPQLQFVTKDKMVLIRQSSKGTYTKKKSFEGELPPVNPDDRYLGLTDKLFSDFVVIDKKTDQTEQTGQASESPASSTQSNYQKEGRKRLARRIKTIRKSLTKLEKDTADTNLIEKLENEANLAKSYAYLLEDRIEKLVLPTETTGLESEVVIELDPDLSSGQNIVRLFDLAKKARRSLEVGEKKIKSTKSNLSAMENDLKTVTEGSLLDSDVASLLKRHKLPLKQQQGTASKKTTEASPYKCFASSGEFPILVGKGAVENDELTKNAKSNDHWLHAVGVLGSHVIVRARDGGKTLNEKHKREAAILALHFSKLRKDFSGEVYVAKKSGIRKQKNMPAGLWLIDRADTLFVKYTENELKTLLDRYLPDGK